MMRTIAIFDEVHKRGWLTRAQIEEVREAYYGEGRREFTLDDLKGKIDEFAHAKNRHERGRVIVYLACVRWTGVFDAHEMAHILLGKEGMGERLQKAADKVADWSEAYGKRLAEAEILKREAEGLIPSGVRAEWRVSCESVTVEFRPRKGRSFSSVTLHGATDIYFFLKAVRSVRPMLEAEQIGFGYGTLEEIGGVWNMGQSIIAYGGLGSTGAEIVEREKNSYKDYLAGYALPDSAKAKIIDCILESVEGVKYGVWMDVEGVEYNSLVRRPLPVEVA